ncbi:hypothetical protein [Bacteroides sedimenti]|uniref:Cysteine-rich CPCC domain-containing protein n=1 Tax=Bacteroides sedimenti TaxID=2136147 RepID=A0ABN6Z6C8_9BACE
MKEHNCRVCGLYIEDKPWGKDGLCPTYEICPCCGVEFGNEDYTPESIKRFRNNWIQQGAKWDESRDKPENWNLNEQLRDIPDDYL